MKRFLKACQGDTIEVHFRGCKIIVEIEHISYKLYHTQINGYNRLNRRCNVKLQHGNEGQITKITYK